MTKTKEVDVHNSPAHLFFASPKERRLQQQLQQRVKMDSGGGTESTEGGQAKHDAPGKKKGVNRAPSPARPKDVPGWSFTKIRGGIGTPTLSVKPGGIHLGSRVSRRSPVGSLGSGKDGASKAAGKHSSAAKSSTGKGAKNTRRKVSDASTGSEDLSKDSGCAPEKLSPTDSSSELSDCPSDENKLSTDAFSSDTESRSSRGGAEGEHKPLRDAAVADRSSHRAVTSAGNMRNIPMSITGEAGDKDRLSLGGIETGEGSISPGDEKSLTSFDSRVPASTSLAFSDLTEELMDSVHEEYAREIEELRSENDYLKDEMEELRSEMLEMRDMYMEEDVYQLQDLRQQLEQANKTCRILQYRLRKAERRSLRVAQTGQVDGELIRTLEQDLKVAKDVSIRLHSQLEGGEKKRTRLEEENEELRNKLQDLEVAKQVLQQEIDKSSQKKRGARANNKAEKKPCPQEDSSDLKCQLHFAKEESAMMCKKLTKLVKESEAMREELSKYRSLYGDVDASLTVEEVADSPHTREAEVRVHLKLVEEEANLLSRRIVELEVENRGLRAEMDDMKGPQDISPDLTGSLSPGLGIGGGAMVLGGGASSENVMELQRHLQFVEEEAELLRRSLTEMEEQNKLLMNEINRYKSELPPSLSSNSLASLTDGLLNDSPVHSIQEGAVLINVNAPSQEEELRLARLQIGELSGKVKKLQYENRVLLSNLQRCDLASYNPTSSPAPSTLRLNLETDAEAGDSAECLPSPPSRREPVGGETDPSDLKEHKRKSEDSADSSSLPVPLVQKDHDALLSMRDQARLVSTAIQLLISPESSCLQSPSLYHKVCTNESKEGAANQEEEAESCDQDKSQSNNSQISELSDLSDRPLVGALTGRLQALHSQLQAFVERVDGLSRAPPPGAGSGATITPEDASLAATTICSEANIAAHKQPDSRDQSEPDVRGQRREGSQSEEAPDLDNVQPEQESENAQCSDLQVQLSQTQEVLERERLSHTELTHKITQLQEEQHKALVRRDFQLQSVGLQARLHQRLWAQERNLLLQESQHLKHTLLLLSLKLRCLLKQWRIQGGKDAQWKDVLEINSLKDLYLLLDEENCSPSHQAADAHPVSPTIKSSAVSSTLADLRVALQDLSGELHQERQGSQELTQQFAKAKASWEVERAELKNIILQLETKAGKPLSSADAVEAPDLKVALKKEREEHQHLLAESYAAVMDLTKQLQIGERNWSREKLDLLERFGAERAQWEQRLREATGHHKPKSQGSDSSAEGLIQNGSASPRTKSMSDLEVNGAAEKLEKMSLLIRPEPYDITRKNWTNLTNETPEVGNTCKTWDGSSLSSEQDLDSAQRSYTAPDRTGIRIYYSPPTVRRMEQLRSQQRLSEQLPAQNGCSSPGMTAPESGSRGLNVQGSSSYEQWLSSLSTHHKELLESRAMSVPASANSVVSGLPPSSPFSDFQMVEISANLSDDMKEMTNCVRQAIRSSSLERKSSKEPGSPVLGTSSRSTQTSLLCVSVALQTDCPPTSRGLQSKVWSPRPTTSTANPLASARSRHISTSLDKVHGRIERPCCSPKYGSPKLQRRVSSGSTSRLDTSSSSSRDRSLWSLQQRPGGSAWARSTTTRDSPVLSGLTDGLSSLFSVVEHTGSTESLWRGEPVSPARQPLAAGKPSGERYGGLQDMYRDVSGGRTQAGLSGSGERCQREALVGVDEPKPECLSAGTSAVGLGALAGLGAAPDPVTRIVNKRFMRQTAGEEMGCIMGGGTAGAEDALCDCGFSRPSRSSGRHSLGQCKHRLQDSAPSLSSICAEEKGETSTE
ncbi:protein SOGA1 [Periophthalmus magnuspinnatus]|uniref:protein SOGA1 n=1 Tax=Periophthalmus magnuspinnatus TaxID=409849 RepID=UPI00145BA376|nr:protein SOGA1 [Periophthalmus magnuspinnatus]